MKKFLTLVFLLASLMSFSQSTTLVISQVYGAGGNTGAPLNADYVELHNISTVPQSLAGLSIQYGSATNTNWTGVAALPAVSVPPGGFFLIQMSSTGTNGSPLPTIDHQAAPTISMSATAGKVALVVGITALTGCPTTDVIDKVGYGTANCSENTPTAALSVNNAAFRNNNGCTDTDNNLSDFTLAAPAPRNSASPVSICGAATPAITAGTLTDFGNVNIGSSSASQTFNISGTNLTGFPGNITVTAPNSNFQVSLNGTTWSASVSIPYTSATLSSTQVFVQFVPQAAGPQSGNISINGGGIASPVTVAVSGNGVNPSTPSIGLGGTLAFGNVCINTVGGPASFTITGSSLTTQDVSVAALNGYQFATVSGGPYSNSLTLTQPGGAYTQTVFVQFNPSAAISYNGSISVSGGGISSAVTIAVTGAGVNTAASVTTGSASAITTNSATIAANIPSIGCSAVTAYGFEYSLTNGFANGTGTNVASTNLSGGNFSAGLSGLTPSTTYYYKAYVTNAGGTVYGTQQSFTTAAPPPPVLNATGLAPFGSICVNNNEGPNSFDITGSNLTSATITVGPLPGYTFSTSSNGTFTETLTITPSSGSVNQTVYVLFSPLIEASYAGNIPVTGAGAPAISVPATGDGINSRASLLTGDSLVISANIVEARGTILDDGCSDVTAYGIEYSGINGFINGNGRRVFASNLNGGNFFSRLEGLVQNTIYYYKAFAINNGGIAYGSQRSFITPAIGGGLIIYAVPIIRGGSLHYSLSGIKPGHYSTRIWNSLGQLVYQREVITPVDFIDDTFTFPSTLPMGLYNMEVRNHEFKIQKPFLVN